MRRHRLPEFTSNHERWLISYADFITLLFAFFVLMYSTSAANNGDFRVLSDAIVRALGLPGLALEPARPGDTGSRAVPAGIPNRSGDPVRVPLRAAANDEALRGAPEEESISKPLQGLQDTLRSSLGDLLTPDRLQLAPDSRWLEIKIPARLLFPSGSRAVLADAEPMLARLAELLGAVNNDIVVQGHTDNRPIRNGLFPSNWELSSARAAAIARILERRGIAPERLSVQGYAATRPLAANDSEAGRRENRRVVLLVRERLADAREAG